MLDIHFFNCCWAYKNMADYLLISVTKLWWLQCLSVDLCFCHCVRISFTAELLLRDFSFISTAQVVIWLYSPGHHRDQLFHFVGLNISTLLFNFPSHICLNSKGFLCWFSIRARCSPFSRDMLNNSRTARFLKQCSVRPRRLHHSMHPAHTVSKP